MYYRENAEELSSKGSCCEERIIPSAVRDSDGEVPASGLTAYDEPFEQ